MQVLQTPIDSKIQTIIKKVYEENKETLIHTTDDRIGYVNVYHHSWDSNPHGELLEALTEAFGIESNKVASFGFINAPPGKTETYFVPLIDITKDMGTQFITFKNYSLFSELEKSSHFNLLLELSNKFMSTEELAIKFIEAGYESTDFEFHQIQTAAYSLVHLPYNIMHRGVSNRSGRDRPMFQLVTLRDESYKLCSHEAISDAELDESMNVLKIINTHRQL